MENIFMTILDLCGELNVDQLNDLIGCIETMIENMEGED